MSHQRPQDNLCADVCTGCDLPPSTSACDGAPPAELLSFTSHLHSFFYPWPYIFQPLSQRHWSSTSTQHLIWLEYIRALMSVIGNSRPHPIISYQTASFPGTEEMTGQVSGTGADLRFLNHRWVKLQMTLTEAAKARWIKLSVFYESNTSSHWKMISRSFLEISLADVAWDRDHWHPP